MPTALALQHYLAANLHRRREEIGLSQEALADQIGVDARYVRQMESAKGIDVRLSTLRKLAVALGCEPGALLREAAPVERRPGRPRRRTA